MSDKIPTTEEYFDKRYKELGINHADEINGEDVIIAKELIWLHVEAALKAAWENFEFEDGCDTHGVSLKKESILNAYSKENIQ